MATDLKLTELGTPLTPLDGTEEMYVVDGSTDKRTTTQDVANLAPQGDVVHVGSAVVPGNLAAYAQTDGAGIEDSGFAPSDFATSAQGALADSAVQPADSATTLNMNTARLLGRSTAAAGAVEEITVGSGLSLAAGALTATGGSGDVATDAIWDAAGDLAVGTGANTAAKLTMGTALQVLRVNSGATALEYATPSSGGSLTLQQWTALDGQPPAANFATGTTRNSIAGLNFDASTDESTVFVGIIPEGAVLTGGISVFLKVIFASATSGAAIFESSFERSNTDLDSDSFGTVKFASGTANATSGIVTTYQIDHSSAEIDGVTAGDLFRLKISRDANGTNGTDDATGDATLIAVEIRGRA